MRETRGAEGRWVRSAGLGVLSIALGLGGCSGTPPQAATPAVASASSAAPTADVPSVAAEPSYPKTVDDLAAAVPKDATLAASIPGLGLVAKVPGIPTDTVLPIVAAEIAKKTGVPEAVVRQGIEGFDGAEIFLLPRPRAEKPPFAAILRFKDAKAVEAILAASKLERVDAHRFRGEGSRGQPIEIAWLPEPRVAIVGSDPAAVSASLDALSGRAPSFQTSPLFKPGSADRASVVADLAALVADTPEFFDAGSKLALSIGLAGSEIEFAEYGARVPRLGAVLAPSSHDALGKLPGHALFAADLSLRRRSGKTLSDLLAEVQRHEENIDSRHGSGPTIPELAEEGLRNATGMGLADLDRALGDSIAIGGYLPSTGKGSLEERMKHEGAMFVTIATHDDKTARAFLDKLSAAAKKNKRGKTTASPGKLTVEKDDVFLRVEAQKDAIAIAFGAKKTAGDLMTAFTSGKGTLSEDAAFVDYKRRAAKESSVAQYGDVAAIVAALGPELGDSATQLKSLTSTLAADITASPSDKGLEITARGDGVAAVLGTFSAVAIYGVRRYITESKSAEAKNNVGMIARSAVAAFERETAGKGALVQHKLCDAATPVPAKVQKATKYAPVSDKGKDFDTGSDTAGWRCLKVAMSEPIYFQYDYRVGHGYKGPARGGPNPGPKGFEVSAEGDLDGDGKTSLFTLTGKVGADGTVHLDREIFMSDPDE